MLQNTPPALKLSSIIEKLPCSCSQYFPAYMIRKYTRQESPFNDEYSDYFCNVCGETQRVIVRREKFLFWNFDEKLETTKKVLKKNDYQNVPRIHKHVIESFSKKR